MSSTSPPPSPTTAPPTSAAETARAERLFQRRFGWLILRQLKVFAPFEDADDLLTSAAELGVRAYRSLKEQDDTDLTDADVSRVQRVVERVVDAIRKQETATPSPVTAKVVR